jgi:hypothetical protein
LPCIEETSIDAGKRNVVASDQCLAIKKIAFELQLCISAVEVLESDGEVGTE